MKRSMNPSIACGVILTLGLAFGPLLATSARADGACCFYPGSTCELLTADDCAANGGVFLGDGTTCDPNPCILPGTGACCNAQGVPGCLITPQSDCESQGGIYEGDGVPCNPSPCPPDPVGACCYVRGADGWVCLVCSQTECSLEFAGVFHGAGSVCGQVLCDASWGSCCRPDGTCFVCDVAGCASENGSFQGAGTTCTPGLCPPPTPTASSSWGVIKARYR